MKMSRVVLLVALLLTFGAFSTSWRGAVVHAAEEDPLDDEASVETEDEVVEDGRPDPGTAGAPGAGKAEEELTKPEEILQLQPAPDVETAFLITKFPEEELPAGKLVQCLIAFHNTGADKSYNVHSIQASLRYPMDYSYYLQNFTKAVINRTVEPNREATFSYVFRTSDHFVARPFGFVIELLYADEVSAPYMSTVFNKTITFTESEEGIDMQAIMLYLLIAAVVALAGMIVYYNFFTNTGGKSNKKRAVETGTMNGNAASNEWLPAHARTTLGSPKPKTTPKGGKKSKKEN